MILSLEFTIITTTFSASQSQTYLYFTEKFAFCLLRINKAINELQLKLIVVFRTHQAAKNESFGQ